MSLMFEIFGSARNHGKKFLKFNQTSISGIAIPDKGQLKPLDIIADE